MAQIEAQRLLSLAERANSLCYFDLECTNLNGDYGSIMIGSIKPYEGKVTTYTVDTVGEDKSVCEQIRNELHKYDVWVSYYGKGFDTVMLQARLLVNNLAQLEKRHHVDLYYVLTSRIKTSRRSQAHFLSFLSAEEQKMTVGANEWNKCLSRNEESFNKMIKRCESDVEGLKALYEKCRHLIVEVTR